MGTYYSFREQRLNLIAANYRNKQDSFTIGIKDINCNGVFTDKGIDEVYLADYKTERFAGTPFPIQGTDGTYIESTGHVYHLSGLKDNGAGFYLKEVFDRPFEHQLNIGEKVPKIKYQIADSGKARKKKLCKFRRKPTYVYFSSSRAENFTRDTIALRKLHQHFGHKVNVLFLNSGDIPRQAKKIAVLGKLPYHCGISTTEIDEKWFIKTRPTGFFLEKKLKLQVAGINPEKLYLYLDTLYDRKETK